MDLQHIGRYDIKSMIGQGGMSTVYLGYDPRSHREVAIKVLPPYYLHSTKFRERFEREALMIALLEHPAIVPVYDMGEEEGQPYIVMRYMSGGSLSDKLKKGSIPLRECVDMYLRLAPALDTAHARGVTHRDVKPDNLLFDKYDNVFLSDFGLARLRETIGFANISDGSIMGTPAYMSPEQIQGDQAIDGRSDIYSMGVVLYQMLCGVVPFSGTTAASVMMMHLVDPVPQIVEVNTSLPHAIQSVLDKAMAKKSDDRYQSVGEFARAIQSVTTGVQRKLSIQFPPIPGKVPSRPYPLPNIPAANHHTPANHDVASVATPDQVNGNVTPAPMTLSEDQDRANVTPDVEQPAPSNPPSEPSNKPVSLLKQRYLLPVWAWMVTGIVLVILSLLVILWTEGILPFSSSTDSLINSSSPPAQSTSASQSFGTVTASSQSPIILGQADKLAFIKSSDIWVSNLDGSDRARLTTDGSLKSNLHWSPDGQSVIFTSANCIRLVGLQTQTTSTVTCFSGNATINAFDVSPDGQQVALGLEGSSLYLLPYTQLFNLHYESLPSDITPFVTCSYYAPYDTGATIKAAYWSPTPNRIALLLSTLVDGSFRDEVAIYNFSQCEASPTLVQEIQPASFLFTLRGYFEYSEISGLSWNGNGQILVNGYVNSTGFGDLQLYNLLQDKSQELAPNGTCCYRDVHWSPDGTYLFYSYQPEDGGDIRLFYIPSAEISQPGETMASLALPAGFLDGNQGSLQPSLRTVH
jgi:serine/threonine protein kinase